MAAGITASADCTSASCKPSADISAMRMTERMIPRFGAVMVSEGRPESGTFQMPLPMVCPLDSDASPGTPVMRIQPLRVREGAAPIWIGIGVGTHGSATTTGAMRRLGPSALPARLAPPGPAGLITSNRMPARSRKPIQPPSARPMARQRLIGDRARAGRTPPGCTTSLTATRLVPGMLDASPFVARIGLRPACPQLDGTPRPRMPLQGMQQSGAIVLDHANIRLLQLGE